MSIPNRVLSFITLLFYWVIRGHVAPDW